MSNVFLGNSPPIIKGTVTVKVDSTTKTVSQKDQSTLAKIGKLFSFSSKPKDVSLSHEKKSQSQSNLEITLRDAIESTSFTAESDISTLTNHLQNQILEKQPGQEEIKEFLAKDKVHQGIEIYKTLKNFDKSPKTILSKLAKMISFKTSKASLTNDIQQKKSQILKEVASELKKSNSVKGDVITVLDNIIDTADSGMDIHHELYKKLETLAQDPGTDLQKLLEFDKATTSLRNQTHFSNAEIDSIEKDLGIEGDIFSLKHEYSGFEDKEFGAQVVNGLLGNIPGGSTALKMAHVDKVRDSKVNIGTEKASVFDTLPEFSESSSVGGTSLRSIGDIVVKTPIRILLKPITMVSDMTTGVGVGLSRLATKGNGFQDSISNRGLTRKTIVRSLINQVRGIRRKAVGILQLNNQKINDKTIDQTILKIAQKTIKKTLIDKAKTYVTDLVSQTHEKTIEQQLINKINLTRTSLANTKQPEQKQTLLSNLRMYSSQLRKIVNAQKQTDKSFDELNTEESKTQQEITTDSRSIESLHKEIDETGLNNTKEVTQDEKELEVITSTTINSMRKTIENHIKGLKGVTKTFKLLVNGASKEDKKVDALQKQI